MEARNVSDYLFHIKEITSRFNLVSWYRGQADEIWDLKPTVWRDYSREQERSMNHEFLWKAKTRTTASPTDKDWPGWLSLMQHFGLPTRLLDWSKSPLIALYFALENYFKFAKDQELITNASVWILFPSKLNVVSGLDNYIYSIYNETAVKMIEPAFSNPRYVTENEKIIAVSSVENDLRMLLQQSAFTIHSSLSALDKYEGNENFLMRIDIPRECLHIIAFELDLLGFKISQIFPDLEHLATEIRNRYKKLR